MYYAPVIIPTCNRINHLKRCIQSLEKNSHAADTELYIAIDYPPNEKFENGYQDVKKWLDTKESWKFYKVFVFQHGKNLGPERNIEFLIEKATERHDRWIVTEDDNEFSPNFLEFMNKCLEKYKDDDSVFSICGFCETKYTDIVKLQKLLRNSKRMPTAVKSGYFQPYGAGFWKGKFQKFQMEKEQIILNPYHAKAVSIARLFGKRVFAWRTYIKGILFDKSRALWKNDWELSEADGVIQLYLAYTGRYSIFPLEYKSRTCGNDGSGFTMHEVLHVDMDKTWPLDHAGTFKMNVMNEGKTETVIRRHCNYHYSMEHKLEILKLIIKYCLFRASVSKRKRLELAFEMTGRGKYDSIAHSRKI